MHKVTLPAPSKKWIKDAKVDFFREGMFKGAMGIELEFTGEKNTSSELTTQVIMSLLKEPLPKRKIIRISGPFNGLEMDYQLDTMIRALKDYGFLIQAIIDGKNSFPWLDSLNWLIIRTKEPFVAWKSHEVWYCPDGEDEIMDLQLPQESILYLQPNRRTIEQVEQFMLKSRWSWALL
jgi:hypothetical protein